MPTGQAVVNSALTALGILEQGGVPSDSDSNDVLSELNDQWQAWGIDEGLIFAQQNRLLGLNSGQGSYAVGPTATAPFNIPLPARIYTAVYVTNQGRNELKIVEANQYYAHNDLQANAVAPDELYPDYNVDPTTGLARLYLWPVPQLANTSLELNVSAQFVAWALGVNYQLPQGYQDAIKWALAYRCLSRFGVAVASQVADVVRQEGIRAEERLRTMNAKNRQLPAGMAEAPGKPAQAQGA